MQNKTEELNRLKRSRKTKEEDEPSELQQLNQQICAIIKNVIKRKESIEGTGIGFNTESPKDRFVWEYIKIIKYSVQPKSNHEERTKSVIKRNGVWSLKFREQKKMKTGAKKKQNIFCKQWRVFSVTGFKLDRRPQCPTMINDIAATDTAKELIESLQS